MKSSFCVPRQLKCTLPEQMERERGKSQATQVYLEIGHLNGVCMFVLSLICLLYLDLTQLFSSYYTSQPLLVSIPS